MIHIKSSKSFNSFKARKRYENLQSLQILRNLRNLPNLRKAVNSENSVYVCAKSPLAILLKEHSKSDRRKLKTKSAIQSSTAHSSVEERNQSKLQGSECLRKSSSRSLRNEFEFATNSVRDLQRPKDDRRLFEINCFLIFAKENICEREYLQTATSLSASSANLSTHASNDRKRSNCRRSLSVSGRCPGKIVHLKFSWIGCALHFELNNSKSELFGRESL